jgi:hypothetical protein
MRSISGLDLKVGGEWARNLYDKSIVNFMNRFAKRFGSKVGETELAGNPKITREPYVVYVLSENSGYWVEAGGFRDGPYRTEAQAEGVRAKLINDMSKSRVKVHSIPITPEMRKSVVQEGVPIAKAGPEPASSITRQLESLAV